MTKLTIGITFFDRLSELKSNLEILTSEITDRVSIVIINDNVNIELSTYDLIDNSRHEIKIINNAINMGEYSNFITLFNQCETEYFTWLSDDDIYESGLLSDILDIIRINDFDIIFTEYKLKYRDKCIKNSKNKKQPHDLILAKRIKSVSLYCIYKKNFLKNLISTIPSFCDAKVALYFEYALLLNIYNYKYSYYILNNKKIIINNTISSWSASNSDVEFWRSAFINLLKYANNNINLDFIVYIQLFKIMLNDQVAVAVRSCNNGNRLFIYFQLLKFLFSNIDLAMKSNFYLLPVYIFYSVLYSLKMPILLFKRRLCVTF